MDKVYLVEIHNWDSHGGWEYVTTAHPTYEAAVRSIHERLGFMDMEVEGKRYFVDPDYMRGNITQSYQMFEVRRAVVRSVPFHE